MIYLLNKKERTFKWQMTNHPVTNPQESPMPTGKNLEDLDVKKMNYKMERDAILNHPNYSEAFEVVLRPGLNKYENHEQAEWIYREMGSSEDAGTILRGKTEVQIKNNNFVFEVNEKGEEVKDNFYNKYRLPTGVQMYTKPNPELEVLKPLTV